MANSPLQKIVTGPAGRGAQLELGVGNNQYVRASDFNPVVDYINNQAGVNQVAGTAGNSATINSVAGSQTSGSLTLATAATQDITITNSYVTTSSIVMSNLEYAGTTGIPVIRETVVSNGQVVFTVTNAGAAALNGTVTIKFIVF
jgi:hypothetical protein